MKVDSLSPVNNHPHILCRFNLTFPNGITIRDVTMMTGSKGRWISWPSRSYKDKEGKDKYFQYVQVDKDRKEQIEAEIKLQVDKIMAPKPNERAYNPDEQVPF